MNINVETSVVAKKSQKLQHLLILIEIIRTIRNIYHHQAQQVKVKKKYTVKKERVNKKGR